MRSRKKWHLRASDLARFLTRRHIIVHPTDAQFARDQRSRASELDFEFNDDARRVEIIGVWRKPKVSV